VTLGGENPTGVAIARIRASIQIGDTDIDAEDGVGVEVVKGTGGITLMTPVLVHSRRWFLPGIPSQFT